jgi:hypothetical protein
VKESGRITPDSAQPEGRSCLSIDLAFRRYADIGVCALRDTEAGIEVARFRLEDLGLRGQPKADALAKTVAALAADLGARLVFVDGPQAWKAPDNGLEHSRLCERALATPGKTGLPGVTKPANYGPFIAFSIDFFDELSSLGWPRLASQAGLDGDERFAIESFPTSAWRGLGLRPLPGKAKTTSAMVGAKLEELRAVHPLACHDEFTHDELQAVVAGLAGVAAEGHAVLRCETVGAPPFELEGTWREGFIVNPATQTPPSLRKPLA